MLSSGIGVPNYNRLCLCKNEKRTYESHFLEISSLHPHLYILV